MDASAPPVNSQSNNDGDGRFEWSADGDLLDYEPVPWVRRFTLEGRAYWFNHLTKQNSFDEPGDWLDEDPDEAESLLGQDETSIGGDDGVSVCRSVPANCSPTNTHTRTHARMHLHTQARTHTRTCAHLHTLARTHARTPPRTPARMRARTARTARTHACAHAL